MSLHRLVDSYMPVALNHCMAGRPRPTSYWLTPEVRKYFRMLGRWAGTCGRGECKRRGDRAYYQTLLEKGLAVRRANKARREAEALAAKAAAENKSS